MSTPIRPDAGHQGAAERSGDRAPVTPAASGR